MSFFIGWRLQNKNSLADSILNSFGYLNVLKFYKEKCFSFNTVCVCENSLHRRSIWELDCCLQEDNFAILLKIIDDYKTLVCSRNESQPQLETVEKYTENCR